MDAGEKLNLVLYLVAALFVGGALVAVLFDRRLRRVEKAIGDVSRFVMPAHHMPALTPVLADRASEGMDSPVPIMPAMPNEPRVTALPLPPKRRRG